MTSWASVFLCASVFLWCSSSASAQDLESRLLAEPANDLADAAVESGDAKRGAIVFHQPHMGCAKCHRVGGNDMLLGPNLATAETPLTDVEIVDSILRPSKAIRKGYESISVVTGDGVSIIGLLVSEDNDQLILRDAANLGRQISLSQNDIEVKKENKVSIMPAGQVNQLAGRQQFLDLVKYLMEIRDGGTTKVLELQPPPHLLVAPPIPEYEKRIDHAGMIRSLDDTAFERGEAIYSRLCVNCHGTKDQPGSLPTSLRFADGKFKNGSDPFAMYQTLTRGFGMMLPQTWMVPQQKYDVIHYIRRVYLRRQNPSQYVHVDADYLATLPKGDSYGPAPVLFEPWVNMDYGPSMINTFETGDDATNFAYKGIAMRLDPGPGGVSRGNAWITFDHDTMRVSTAWTKPKTGNSSPFINWQGIHFDGRHNIHPRISGDVHLQNLNGPGWANPATGSFDDPRLVGRDGRKYGPLPRDWARLNGIYSHGPDTIIDYVIGTTNIQESPTLLAADPTSAPNDAPIFARRINVGPRDRDLVLQVASFESNAMQIRQNGKVVSIQANDESASTNASKTFEFNGASYQQTDGSTFDMTDRDYTLTARVRTKTDGTIFSKTADQSRWAPNAKAFFIRQGRLTFDIGWVGAVSSKKRIDDGKWHNVAVRWNKSGEVRLYVDGKTVGKGNLRPKAKVTDHVVRLGFAADNFPEQPFFQGDLRDVRFIQRALAEDEIRGVRQTPSNKDVVAHWSMTENTSRQTPEPTLTPHSHKSPRAGMIQSMVAGISADLPNSKWSFRDNSRL
ncbi:MAG: heme-binding protein, partial [Pirellulaceae bacterium]|nr:heme-binding protein [Pirellulaceae bacterium]